MIGIRGRPGREVVRSPQSCTYSEHPRYNYIQHQRVSSSCKETHGRFNYTYKRVIKERKEEEEKEVSPLCNLAATAPHRSAGLSERVGEMKCVWSSSDRLVIDLGDADTFFEFLSLSLAKAQGERGGGGGGFRGEGRADNDYRGGGGGKGDQEK